MEKNLEIYEKKVAILKDETCKFIQTKSEFDEDELIF